MKRLLVLAGAIVCLMVVHGTTLAAGEGRYPPGWPWRGVVIDSFGEQNDPEEIQYLAAQGVNAVELVLSVRSQARYRRMAPGTAWRHDLEWADRMLDACRRHGVTAILSVYQFPIDPALGIEQNSRRYWNDPALLDDSVRLVGDLAAHFHGRGAELGAYEFLSEPLVLGIVPKLPAAWPAFARRLIAAVRVHDPERFIVHTPGIGGEASEYAGFEPLPEPNIVYGAHFYNPHAFTHQGVTGRPRGCVYPGPCHGRQWDRKALAAMLEPLVDFQRRTGAPVWIGEMGAVRWSPGGDTWLEDLTGLLDARGIGWMYFCYNGWHGWSPFHDAGFSSDDLADSAAHRQGRDAPRWRMLQRRFAAAHQVREDQ